MTNLSHYDAAKKALSRAESGVAEIWASGTAGTGTDGASEALGCGLTASDAPAGRGIIWAELHEG